LGQPCSARYASAAAGCRGTPTVLMRLSAPRNCTPRLDWGISSAAECTSSCTRPLHGGVVQVPAAQEQVGRTHRPHGRHPRVASLGDKVAVVDAAVPPPQFRQQAGQVQEGQRDVLLGCGDGCGGDSAGPERGIHPFRFEGGNPIIQARVFDDGRSTRRRSATC
jgi:hypothetical protein